VKNLLSREISTIALGIAFIFIVILSASGVFRAEFGVLVHFFLALFAVGVLYLIFYRFWGYFQGTDWTRKVSLLILLFLHIVIQVSGGNASPLFPLYYLFLVLIVIKQGITLAAWLTVGALMVEVIPLLLADSWEESSATVIKFGFVLIGIYIVSELVQVESHIKQEAKDKIQEIEDLKSTVKADPIDFKKANKIQLLSDDESAKWQLQKSLTLNDYIDVVLNTIQRILNAHSVLVFLKDENQRTFSLRSAISTGTLDPRARINKFTEGLGWIIKEKRSILIGNLESRKEAVAYYEIDEPISCLLASPIILDDELEGILVVDSTYEDAYKPEDKQIVEEFADHVSLLIDGIRAKARCLINSIQFSAVYEVSRTLSTDWAMEDILKLLSDIAYKIVPCDGLVVALSLRGGEEGMISVIKGEHYTQKEGMTFPLDGGLVGLVIKNRKHLFIPDLTRGEKRITRFKLTENRHPFISFLAVPLMAHSDTLGALVLESMERNAFSEHDLRILMILANLVSSAVVNGQMRKQVERYMHTDHITGAFTHSQFQTLLQEQFEEANQHHFPLSIFFADVDKFEELNQRLGYDAGDEILRDVAGLMKDVIGQRGILARYNNDCFVALLPEVNRQEVLQIAQKIRSVIMEHPFIIGSKPVEVTVSIGSVTFPVDVKTRPGMLELGWQALEQAKSKGENQIKIYGHSVSVE
jgi:diguanylate cyclase (GGDEF)-like protein